jgi:predicted TIM-barrel enzyme
MRRGVPGDECFGSHGGIIASNEDVRQLVDAMSECRRFSRIVSLD